MTKAQEMLERQLTEWFNALPGESLGKNNYDEMIGIVRLTAQADAPGGQPQCPALPDRERMAEILYTAAHEGLRNCWKWSDAGLDHEHPTSRGYWYKVADGALAALSVTRPVRNPE
jgi:hypothetical protein